MAELALTASSDPVWRRMLYRWQPRTWWTALCTGMCGRDCFYFTIFTAESQKKITIDIQKNHTIEIQKNHLNIKLKKQHRYTYQKQKIPIAWRPSLWYSKRVSENVPFSISAVHRQFAAVSGKATKENREQESDAFWGDRGRNFFTFSSVKTREFRKIPVDI